MSVEFALSLYLSLSFVSGDLLIAFRPNCPRNCGRAAHQNVEVLLSNHGLLIFLPNCLQKIPLWLIGWLQNWKTPTHLWYQKKKSISGEHGNIKGWMATMGGSKRPTLYNLYLRESLFIYDIMVLMSQWNDCAACRMPLFWKLNFMKSSSQEKVGKTELLRPSDQVYRFKTILGGKFRLWVRKISFLKFKEHSRHQPGYDQTSHYKWGRKVSPRKITVMFWTWFLGPPDLKRKTHLTQNSIFGGFHVNLLGCSYYLDQDNHSSIIPIHFRVPYQFSSVFWLVSHT